MRLLVLANPTASTVTARTRVTVTRALKSHHDVTVALTERRSHAAALARGAANDGIDVVVVLGGDGTVNEAVNGLAGTDCALAVLPGGSTNVFARSIGCDDDPLAATDQVLSSLEQGRSTRIGLGRANGRYFVLHVGVGFDAAVVGRVERSPSLKRYAGHPLFLWSALAELGSYDRRERQLTVSTDTAERPVKGFTAVVLNTDPYTYLGRRPLRLAPGTSLSGGLTCVTVTDMGALALFSTLARGFCHPEGAAGSPGVDVAPDLASVVLRSAVPLGHQIDGEPAGPAEVVEIVHHPASLNLVEPSASHLSQ